MKKGALILFPISKRIDRFIFFRTSKYKTFHVNCTNIRTLNTGNIKIIRIQFLHVWIKIGINCTNTRHIQEKNIKKTKVEQEFY